MRVSPRCSVWQNLRCKRVVSRKRSSWIHGLDPRPRSALYFLTNFRRLRPRCCTCSHRSWHATSCAVRGASRSHAVLRRQREPGSSVILISRRPWLACHRSRHGPKRCSGWPKWLEHWAQWRGRHRPGFFAAWVIQRRMQHHIRNRVRIGPRVGGWVLWRVERVLVRHAEARRRP